ncbi:MAG: hypothetical protein KDJ99_22120 [Candidatus Competibacteraceae bacterium]|nr:hypothetical protein [Candidatus Competibacteraceae bacterium]
MSTDSKKAPDYIAYTIKALGEKRSKWVEVGVAFTNKSERGGFTLYLDALPVDGKLVVMPPKSRDGQAG